MKHSFNTLNTKLIYLSLFAYSFFILLFCTKSSPFFAFNDWFDGNVYFTMGKGLFNGFVPYVSLIDNKGPLHFFLYGVGYLIDHTGFTGVYIVQSIVLAISLIYAYKLAKIFIDNKSICYIISILSPIFMFFSNYYALGYNFGGPSPDEFCRAFMIISLYYFVIYFEGDSNPKYMFYQGILMACVFLVKYNIFVFWAGFLFVFFLNLVIKREFTKLGKAILSFISGFVLTFIPYTIYALMTNSLKAFIDKYILYNFLYADFSISIQRKILNAFVYLSDVLRGDLILATFIILGIIFVLVYSSSLFKLSYIISLMLSTIALYSTLVFPYTTIPFTVFCFFGLVLIGKFANNAIINLKNKNESKFVDNKFLNSYFVNFVLVFLVIAATIGSNRLVTYQFFQTNEKTCQQEMAEYIKSIDDGDGDITLLELYSLDSGFYTTLNVIPNIPYFYLPNISYSTFPNALDNQLNCIEEKGVNYAIICSGSSDHFTEENKNIGDIRDRIILALLGNYDEINVLKGTGYQSDRFYHLFKLK